MPLTSSHTVIAPKDHQEALLAAHTSAAPLLEETKRWVLQGQFLKVVSAV